MSPTLMGQPRGKAQASFYHAVGYTPPSMTTLPGGAGHPARWQLGQQQPQPALPCQVGHGCRGRPGGL